MSTIDNIIRLRAQHVLDKQARAYREPTINANVQKTFANEYDRRAKNAIGTGSTLSPDEQMKRQLDYSTMTSGLENYVGGRVHKSFADPYTEAGDMSRLGRSTEQQGLQNKGNIADAFGDNLSGFLSLFAGGAQGIHLGDAFTKAIAWFKGQPWSPKPNIQTPSQVVKAV